MVPIKHKVWEPKSHAVVLHWWGPAKTFDPNSRTILVGARTKETDRLQGVRLDVTYVNNGRWSWRRIFLLTGSQNCLGRFISCSLMLLIWQSSVFPQVMRSRRQAGGTPQTQGQFELPDGYQYARVHYSGDPSLVSSKSLFSPSQILKLSMVIIVVPSILAILFYMLLDISMCHQNVGKFVPDCNLRGSKFSFGGGGHTPRPP